MTAAASLSAQWHSIQVNTRTCWIFVQLRRDDTSIGCGEASLPGHEASVLDVAQRLTSRALLSRIGDPGNFAAANAPTTLAEAAVVSAIDQALWDLHAQSLQIPVAQALGGSVRHRIAVYANINRRTEARTPAGFAQSARAALAAGYDAFKLAPFDHVSPTICAAGQGFEAMQHGLACIAAVREAIGPRRRLMVDCHWRFDAATAAALLHAAATIGVYWIECPIPENHDNIQALVRLRAIANARGIRMAGLELGIRYEYFRPYCEAGAYDVMMPDVKYIGGLHEMMHTAEQLARHGVQFSPHNPTGPICHAASLQIAAAVESFDMLERQFDETPLFDQLVGSDFGAVVDGHCMFSSAPGIGARLLDHELSRHAGAPVLQLPRAAQAL